MAYDPPPGQGAAQAQANAEQYTRDQIALLINAAPPPLDTLGEIAAAINDDPAFTTHVLHSGSTFGDKGPSVGFDLRRTGTGQGNGNKATYYNLEIDADTIEQVAGLGTMTGSKVEGFNVIHHFGGAGTQGGRNAIEANLFLDGGATDAANTDRNYCALQGQTIAFNSDAGTSAADLRGAVFGAGAWGEIRVGYWFTNVTGIESNVVTQPLGGAGEVPASYVSGIQIASFLQSNGGTYDAAIGISGLGAGPIGGVHIGHKNAILIGAMNGNPALAAGSTIIKVINHANLTTAFDFSGTTFSGHILKTASVQLDSQSLNINGFAIAAPNGNHSIELGRVDGNASTPFIDWHSGAAAIDYDVRMQVSGGDGTVGHGTLTATLGNFTVAGQRTNTTPLIINTPAAQATTLGEFRVNNSAYFTIGQTGSLEIGRQDNVANSTFIDFHSGAVTVDFDARLVTTGGDGAAGGGTLTVNTGTLAVVAQRTASPAFVVNHKAAPTTDIAAFQINGATVVNINKDGALHPGNGAATGGALWAGNGAPAAGLGADGDYYLRNDTPGTANQRVYVKNAGAWTGII